MKKKVFITGIIVLVFLLIYGFEYIRSNQFNIQLVSITPEKIPADGQTEVKLKVRLTDNKARAVEGHSLFAYSKGGGVLRANREITDANGEAQFIYYPYKASTLMKIKDVPIEIIDESNSVILEVNTTTVINLNLVKPEQEKQKENGINMDDIFDE